jgi:Uncharacterized conserved protein
MRQRFTDEMKQAMKSGDKARTSTIRMIIAALKEKDIDARGAGKETATDEEILALLQKMVKQRNESADIYMQGGRPELAEQERHEVEIISSFLPKQMDEAEMKAAIASAISEVNASSIKEMGKVIGLLKDKYAGQMDFAKASALVKTMLA